MHDAPTMPCEFGRATPSTMLERVATGICRRAFSSPEALAYEATIAPAVARVVIPAIRSRFSGIRALDVGCGGGLVAEAIAGVSAETVIGVDQPEQRWSGPASIR